MSILIKGMEMPKNCIDCAFGWNGWCHRINSRAFVEVDMRRHDCPLIEVPPHGRLIDADELEENAQKRLLMCSKNDNQFQKPYEVMRAIALAPTVIPAEGGASDELHRETMHYAV